MFCLFFVVVCFCLFVCLFSPFVCVCVCVIVCALIIIIDRDLIFVKQLSPTVSASVGHVCVRKTRDLGFPCILRTRH